MSSAVLCRRRSIQVESAQAAVALDVQMSFNQRGLWWVEPSFANLIAAPGARACGVLYLLTARELAALKRWEFLGYRDQVVHVQTANGDTVSAHAFLARWPGKAKPPSQRYLNLLIAGAIENRLPEAFIDALRTQPTAPLPLSFLRRRR